MNQNDSTSINHDYFELEDSTNINQGNLPYAGSSLPEYFAQKHILKGRGISELLNLLKLANPIMAGKGVKESIFGEPDPVGPQGLPFSQFMQQKRALNPK
jgi:hypothetical protein